MVQAAANFGGSIPEYYDRFLGKAQFEPFARELARRLPTRPTGPVLEMACGTGIVTRALRGRLDPEIRIIATDISKAMLDYAQATRGDAPGVEWKEADAGRLPFDDAAFSAAVCAFGVMFFPDKPAAFAEARRVLRRGGVLLFNVWDGQENNPHGRANDEVMKSLFPGDPEMRFAALPYSFNDQTVIRSMLQAAGFGAIRFEAVKLPVELPSARDFATGQMRGTPRGALVEQRGLRLEDVIDKVAAALARVGGEKPFRIEAQALFVEATA
jgi:ubiquinone/menaquinone biosynthesis C-methylase UbiE